MARSVNTVCKMGFDVVDISSTWKRGPPVGGGIGALSAEFANEGFTEHPVLVAQLGKAGSACVHLLA